MSKWYSCCFCGNSKMASPIAPNAPKKGDREDREVVKKLGGVVRKLFEQDGDVDKYAQAVGMDEANARILKIAKTEGTGAMIKAMMTREDGTAMDYAESRSRYG